MLQTPIDYLETDLNKPLFVLKMARADRRTGAAKRAENARREIDRIVRRYVVAYPYPHEELYK